ncbi:MAG: helix-turn-helix transcriptional regulator [Acidimicrobiales bacterium]
MFEQMLEYRMSREPRRETMPGDLQQEAKALGDPTRHRIFRYVAEAPAPVGVAELTRFVGLNHNAVRQHLAVLKDAGLVMEEVEGRDRPGRPRLMYRLRPEAAGAWGTVGPYQYLAEMLADALANGKTPREAGRDAGRRQTAKPDPDQDPFDIIEEQIARRGFRPTRATRGAKVDFVLGRCPFEDVAVANRDTVCQAHLGLAEGMADGLGGLEVLRLVAKNPRRAGCRLALRGNDQLAGSHR